MPDRLRRAVVWVLWFITWVGLLAGFVDPAAHQAVVAFSVAHAGLVLALNRLQILAYPVQVRIGALLWMAIGTYVPHMTVFLVIISVGLIGNLFFDYCLLARLLSLLPWNRHESFSLGLVQRALLTPPGRFNPVPPRRA